MPILFTWKGLIGSKTFQNFMFLPNISIKIPDIAVKCSRSLFLSSTLYKKHRIVYLLYQESPSHIPDYINPIWNGGGGGGKHAPHPLVFFFKYLRNKKKVWLCPFMTFSYYLFWTFLRNVSRKFWLAHELLWFCQRGTENFKKKIFLSNFFFWNYFFCKIFQVYIMLKC